MKNLITVLITVTFLLSACAKVMDFAAEEAKINKVLDQNFKALETEDLGLYEKIFANDADMVVFGTDATERVVGWEALKKVMTKQFEATESTKITSSDRVIKVHESGQVAWFSEIIDWEVTADGQIVKMEGVRGTGVLEKRNGNWVIVQMHYSIPAGS